MRPPTPTLVLTLVLPALAIYGPAARKEGVVVATSKTFKEEVFEHDGPVAVQFFAPWCGHCKALKPAWKAATKALKGKVKLVVVDATSEPQLAQKYGVNGYPTIKTFSGNKKKAEVYEGGRDERSLISGLRGLASGSSGSASEKAKPRAAADDAKAGTGQGRRASASGGGGGGGGGGGRSAVFALDDSSFDSAVLEASGLWIVAFVAPWCGHCKNLQPEWQRVSVELEGQVSFGAVDATASKGLAQRYEVSGYPTIKVFHRGEASDYSGGRDAASIKQEALNLLEKFGVAVEVPQLTSGRQFRKVCVERKGSLCAIAFVPHVLDSGAAGRNEYLEVLKAVAKKSRSTFAFFWSEGGAQPSLEEALSPGGMPSYPSLAVISGDKGRYALMREAFDLKHASAFVGGVLRGGTKTYPAASGFGKVEDVEEWDGLDGVLPEEEPLDDLDDVQVDF